ncbi:hypothetical protein ATN37_25495 [Rhodococcus sp. MH15]|uniref:hypothetical protein n=1 Tax=Rhodococcus sp. MH15 TaxID=1761014 RepID=UPI001C4F48B6|nr:hypothetical protein [Rhodococcus sp. MH15]MBW0294019.1 hypothetical protein [Rhodococcus sp. MH15]
MTETTAQPLTSEDIMAAVIDALNNNTIDVMTSAKPNRFRLISKPEQAARDRHPAGRANRSPAALDVAPPSYSLGPCTAEESRRFARILRDLLAALDGEIVVAAFVGECETDLLDPERQEVHRVREFLNGRITMRSELSNLRGCALAVLDSLADQFETGADHSSSPSVDGCGDLTVGEAGSVGGASVSSTGKVDDPKISARYDRALNMIAISVDGEDAVYLPRDDAFTFMDDIAQALEVQAKLGGAA